MKEAGNKKYNCAQYQEAIDEYTKAIYKCTDKTCKVAIDCFNNRAQCYLKEENFNEALDDTTSVLKANLNNSKALLRRGLILERLGEYTDALNDIRKVIKFNSRCNVANQAQHRIRSLLAKKNKSNS